jgi:hypothetical protein
MALQLHTSLGFFSPVAEVVWHFDSQLAPDCHIKYYTNTKVPVLCPIPASLRL